MDCDCDAEPEPDAEPDGVGARERVGDGVGSRVRVLDDEPVRDGLGVPVCEALAVPVRDGDDVPVGGGVLVGVGAMDPVPDVVGVRVRVTGGVRVPVGVRVRAAVPVAVAENSASAWTNDCACSWLASFHDLSTAPLADSASSFQSLPTTSSEKTATEARLNSPPRLTVTEVPSPRIGDAAPVPCVATPSRAGAMSSGTGAGVHAAVLEPVGVTLGLTDALGVRLGLSDRVGVTAALPVAVRVTLGLTDAGGVAVTLPEALRVEVALPVPVVVAVEAGVPGIVALEDAVVANTSSSSMQTPLKARTRRPVMSVGSMEKTWRRHGSVQTPSETPPRYVAVPSTAQPVAGDPVVAAASATGHVSVYSTV